MSLTALIVGGGIAGLAAAVSLSKAGLKVKVLEASSMASEVGAAITVPPNATRILIAWGLDLKHVRMVPYKAMQVVRADVNSMQEVQLYNQSAVEKSAGSPYVLSHRVDLHKALRSLALEQGCEIVTKAAVTSYDASGVVIIADGSALGADLIVAADGVHSRAHIHVVGREMPAIPSDTTVIRFMLPTKDVLADPLTAPLLARGEGQVSIYTTAGGHKWLVRYPCRNNELQNFGAYANDDFEDADVEETRIKSNRDRLLRRLKGFHPAIQQVCLKTTEILPLWKCADREPLPSLQLNRLVLLGDAAHPMLPNCGQGAASAIEDAAVLGILLGNLHDTSEIPKRLKLYETTRRQRVAAAQVLSRISVGEDSVAAVTAKHPEYFRTGSVPKNKGDVSSFFFSYDCVAEAANLLHGYLKKNPLVI